jgi:hypothetical protein
LNFPGSACQSGKNVALILARLHKPIARKKTTQAVSALFAALLTVAMLLSSLASVSPALHGLMHHEAAPTGHSESHPQAPWSDHQCAASLLAKGSVEPAPVPEPFSRTLVIEAPELLRPSVFVPISIPYRLLPERAPPA